MPGWVCVINCSPNLSMELPKLLTHRRNWRMHSNLSGTSCYPPFMSIGTSQRIIECSRSGFKVWPILNPNIDALSEKIHLLQSHWDKGAHRAGCFIKHIRCFRMRLDLVGIFFPDPLSLLADSPPMGSLVNSGNSTIVMELCLVFTPTLISRFSGNRTTR